MKKKIERKGKISYTKTIKIPIHYETTKQKLDYLNKLTARLTYAVRLWSNIINKNNIKYRKELQNLKYQHYVKKKIKLSSGYVQQAGNKALWMYKQYRKIHKKWKYKLKKAKKNTKWHKKLLKREPSKPFSNPRTLLHKIPVRFDYRTGKVKKTNLKLSSLLIEISTLKKHHKIALLLNPAKYHKELLEKGKIKDFEIIKRKKYYAHITCKYEVKSQHINGIRGMDLGISRDISTVLLTQEGLKSRNFSIIQNVEKKQALKVLNNKISKLQRLEKWNILKKLRHKRLNYSIDNDRKFAKYFANQYCSNNFVFIGHPYNIRYNHYKGDGNKKRRKLLQGWAFMRLANFIKQKCYENGIQAEIINEWQTSSRCHKCNKKVKRPIQSRIICPECNLQYDADFNACINIIHKGNAFLDNKSLFSKAGALDEHARTINDLAQKSMNMEATSWE